MDNENYPVCDYLDFAKAVLRIPQAHEMIAKYTVLDNEKKKLLILRPYQIHAIEAMRAASKRSISGYIWHTTGSGKTMTSYKATRNLLMDIPSIEKTIFLIDRKDLDMQTKMAFQSYADNDTIDVDDTENVDALIRRLTDGNRQMIVTTRQKLQTMIAKRLQEGTKEYDKIRNLRIAFVVDECHRAVTPETKRKIERFFAHSLWYGFTGTPIFEENRYEQKGDLPQTTDELYGACLHSYTIKNAIHDEAVLGFMVENLGPKKEDVDDAVFETEEHMRQVLDVVLNQSYTKLGMQNGKGRTYEGILTVESIAKAQRYYELLKRIKAGKDALKINEEICKVVPDFPKFAITYSVTENDEASTVNQDKMRESLKDYNEMFGTHYDVENINAYNSNLNDRLARKEKRYMERSQQLDLVIVVNRLLTGDQKGLDLVDRVMNDICTDGTQFVVLGTGNRKYEDMFRYYQGIQPAKVSANIYYSDELSHKMYAACDAMLVPSRFEPCGLTQLMALRYGTLPIVRETGGLKDTVIPYNEFEGSGTGFSFANYNAHELLNTINYSKQVYFDKKNAWECMQECAMQQNYSWSNSAEIYQRLYEQV